MTNPTRQPWRRWAMTGTILSAILLGASGADCNGIAWADLGNEAATALTSGMETIVNEVLDGIVTAITSSDSAETVE